MSEFFTVDHLHRIDPLRACWIGLIFALAFRVFQSVFTFNIILNLYCSFGIHPASNSNVHNLIINMLLV